MSQPSEPAVESDPPGVESDPPADLPAAGRLAAGRLAAADRALTILVVVAGAVLLLAHARLSGCGLRAPRVERPDAFLAPHRVDANTADEAELALLPAIGPTLAGRIVAEREGPGGPFRSVDDLRRVTGIGPKTLEKLRPSVTVAPAGPPTPGVPTPGD